MFEVSFNLLDSEIQTILTSLGLGTPGSWTANLTSCIRNDNISLVASPSFRSPFCNVSTVGRVLGSKSRADPKLCMNSTTIRQLAKASPAKRTPGRRSNLGNTYN